MKYWLPLSILLFICSSALGQNEIIVRTESCSFVLNDYRDDFQIRLSITNKSAHPILIPSKPNVIERLSMTESEVGMELFISDTSRKHCDLSYQYLGFSPMIELAAGQTKSIVARLPSSCFNKEEVYNVIFYLKVSRFGKKDEYKYYQSNKIDLRIL